jgi:hypothetical protein
MVICFLSLYFTGDVCKCSAAIITHSEFLKMFGEIKTDYKCLQIRKDIDKTNALLFE